MNRKTDYAALEQEYVTGDVSVRELARRLGMSNGTISKHARDNAWNDKRSSYRDSIARRSYERIADRHASEQAEVTDELLKAMRATIYKYVEALKEGKVIPSTRDAVIASDLILRLFGEPTERTETHFMGVNISANGDIGDPGFLRRLEELTRGIGGTDAPAGPIIRIEGPREN